MELTENFRTGIIPDDNGDAPGPLDGGHVHGHGAERIAPGRPSPPAGETRPPAPDGTDIDALPVVTYCRSLLFNLAEEAETPPDVRQAWMAKALGDLLGDEVLNDLALGEIAQSLHEADTESYEAWANNQFKRGLVLAISTLGLSGRIASNIIALFRPQLIRELGIGSGVETVMLDTALGSLYDYAQATMEIRRMTRSGEARPVKVAGQHARTMASAQPLLKTFLTTIEKLRTKRQPRSLNIQAAGDGAIQVNEAGASGAARAKDEPVLVAEMELPPVGSTPFAEAARPMEAA